MRWRMAWSRCEREVVVLTRNRYKLNDLPNRKILVCMSVWHIDVEVMRSCTLNWAVHSRQSAGSTINSL